MFVQVKGGFKYLACCWLGTVIHCGEVKSNHSNVTELKTFMSYLGSCLYYQIQTTDIKHPYKLLQTIVSERK